MRWIRWVTDGPRSPQEPFTALPSENKEDRVRRFKSWLRYAPMSAPMQDTPYYLADLESRVRELENAYRN